MTLAFGEVRIVGLPVAVHRRAEEHTETLRRELALVGQSPATDAAPAHSRSTSGASFARIRRPASSRSRTSGTEME